MLETIYIDIQKHLIMLDTALTCSARIASYARTFNLQALESETDNRERLVNIISQLQATIETRVNALDIEELSQNEIMVFRCWLQDLAIWSDKMLLCDYETVDCLNQQKENTAKEISSVFKNKEMFKGYNHSAKE